MTVHGQGFDGHDCAVLHKLLIGFLAHDLFDADRPEDFHRSLVDLRRSRMDRGSPMVFDGERTDAVMPEEHRRRQSNKTAADNQNRNFDISHLLLDARHTALSGRQRIQCPVHR